MFRTYKINVSKQLKAKGNHLRIVFYSAETQTNLLAKKNRLTYPCENNRNFARKAQYHFGWDWAPRMITCGIWRQVSLIYTPSEKIADAQYSNVQLIQEKDP
jgi:beta-mannosidase